MRIASLLPPLLLLAACDSDPDKRESAKDTLASPTAEPDGPTASASGAGGRVSRFTRLTDCKVIEEEREEAPWTLSRCPGAGGYDLLVSAEDARENLLLESPGRTGKEAAVSLDLSEATGGGFSRLGDTAEWRGPPGEPFRPDVLVVRHLVVETPDTPSKETSYLLAYALRGGKPCLIGRVSPGPGQSDSARGKADGPLSCPPE